MKSDVKKEKKSRAKKRSLLGAINGTTRKVYRFVSNGVVGRYLCGYDKTCERFENSYFVRLCSRLRRRSVDGETISPEKVPSELEGVGMYDEQKMPRSFCNRFSQAFDSSVIVTLMRKLKELVLDTQLVSYGVMIFAFALFMLLTQSLTLLFSLSSVSIAFLPHIANSNSVLIIAYMVAAVVLMAVSLMLIFAREGSLFSFLTESRISGFFLKNFVGARPVSFRKKSLERHNGRAFVVGMILGLVMFFIPPIDFFKAIGIIIFSAVVINVPEFGLVSLIFVLPFLTLAGNATIITTLLSVLIMISSVLKILRGKRMLHFEIVDLLAVLFLLLTLFGGIFTMGGTESFHAALVFVVLGSMYFAVTLLVKNEAWLNRCINALLLSASIVSLLGILEWLLGRESNTWQDNEIFSALSGRVVSLWENPNVLAEYLLISFFVSAGVLIGRKKITEKGLPLLAFLLSASCLILTWSRGAWIGAAAVLIMMLLMISHKTVPWVALAVVGGVTAFLFLPDTFVDRVVSIVTFSDSSVLYRLNIWKGCSALVRKCFLTGVGVGKTAFSEAYNDFALPGVESAPHAHNLFMQILIELGLMGFIVFALLLLMIVRSGLSLFQKKSMKPYSSVITLSFLSALLALLINGITDYIWYNYRIYLLFWLILGMITATRRIGMKMSENTVMESDACEWSIAVTDRKTTAKRKENLEKRTTL